MMQKKILLEADKAYNSFSDKNMIADKQCHIWTKSVNKNFENKFIECSIKFRKNKAILIIGDSHAMNLYNSFAIHLKDYFVAGISQGGCRIFTKTKICKFDELKKFLLKYDKSINKIFVTYSGGDYLNGNNINKERILYDFLFLKDLNLNEKIYWLGPNINTGISLKDPNIFKFIENGTMNSRINRNILYLDNYLESFVANKLNYISKIKLINYNLKTDFFYNEKFTFARESHWSRYGENYYGKKILNSQAISNLLK